MNFKKSRISSNVFAWKHDTSHSSSSSGHICRSWAEHLRSLHVFHIWISNSAAVYRQHRGRVVPGDGTTAAAGCGPAPTPPPAPSPLPQTGGASSPSDVMTAASAVSSALSLFVADRRPHKGNIWDPLNSLKWRHRRYSWTRLWPTWRRSRRRWSPSWRRRERSCTMSSVSTENGEASCSLPLSGGGGHKRAGAAERLHGNS